MRLVESRTTLTITYVVLARRRRSSALFPIALLVLNSLKPARRRSSRTRCRLPQAIRWDNFARAWKDAKFQPDLPQLGAADRADHHPRLLDGFADGLCARPRARCKAGRS